MVCPLSFWFLFAAFLNEEHDDYEIFEVLLLQHLQRLSSLVFFSHKKKFNLYTTSLLFALLQMGKLMLNALPVVLLSLEQGGLMTFSCKAAFFRKPWRVLSIPEVAFLEAGILASLTAQTKASCTRAWAGELGHFLWRKLLNNIFLICSLYFSKVIAKAFWPMAILESFHSALTLPPCQVKVYFSDRAHWLLVFVIMNTCQTLLSILCALLPYFSSARTSLSLRDIFFNVFRTWCL